MSCSTEVMKDGIHPAQSFSTSDCALALFPSFVCLVSFSGVPGFTCKSIGVNTFSTQNANFRKITISLRKNLESAQMKGTPRKPTYLPTNPQYIPFSHSQPFLPKNVLWCLHPLKMTKSQNQFPPGILSKMKIKKIRKGSFIYSP